MQATQAIATMGRPLGLDLAARAVAAAASVATAIGTRLGALRTATSAPRTAPAAAPLPRPELADRFRTESIVWLSTALPDGRPHLVPIWFTWDGEAFLVFSKPEARKARNIAAEPRVTLAVGAPERDFDVQLIEGHATLLDAPAADVVPDETWHKYGRAMAEIGLTRDEFVATYSRAIRIIPTRFLPWRGRTLGPAF